MTRTERILRTAFAALSLAAAGAAGAAPPPDLDARVRSVIAEYGVPGMAVAIVEDGVAVHAKGYGVRRLGASDPVDADTIFPTGSTGKAVTAAALAVLVDEGRIGWDDKVIEHMPWFQMYDPWVTREITVRDLLVHRSGLGLGAGDLLFVPRASISRAETVRRLRYIKPATSFRSGYAYDNILYAVAGQLIEEVSGMSWEDFVRERVFKPTGMSVSTSSDAQRFATANRVQPHARIDGPMRGIGRQGVLDERDALGSNAAPAGGLSSSANDMARWLALQLARGSLPEGKRLFSEESSRQMWTPQVHIPISPLPEPIADATPQFSSYALGWTVRDYRGVRILEHGGAVFGVQAMVVLVPGRNLGFSLHINSEDGLVLRGLANELLDYYLGFPKRDWVSAFAQYKKTAVDRGLAVLADTAKQRQGKPTRPSLPASGYVGRFRDAWYGPMEVRREGDRLRMDFRQTPDMVGTMTHWRYDTFKVTWDDRAIEPALATFGLDADGRVDSVRMKAASPLADFSYDYQDLLFIPEPAR